MRCVRARVNSLTFAPLEGINRTSGSSEPSSPKPRVQGRAGKEPGEKEEMEEEKKTEEEEEEKKEENYKKKKRKQA